MSSNIQDGGDYQLETEEPTQLTSTACRSMLWQVWHEHFGEAERLSPECGSPALHLLWLESDGLCQIFAYRSSVAGPEAFLHGGSSSESTRGKKHTVSQCCHILFSWPLIMSAGGLGLGLLEVLYIQYMFWDRKEGAEMTMGIETALHETIKQDNLTEEEEEEEKQTSQINKPR